MSLQGRKAVITGGANGIGFATAEEFLKNGVLKVLLLDLGAKLDSAKEAQLKACNPNAAIFYAQCDVSDKRQLEKVLRKDAIQWMGSIDILVNCAGIFVETEPEKCIATNLSAIINGSVIVYDLMSKEKSGRGGAIVNIASVAGLEPFPFGAVYCATKHGIVGYTRSMGAEQIFNKTGVKMVAICPGATLAGLYYVARNTKLVFPWLEADFHKILEGPCQSPNVVGKAVIKAITEGQTGSIWTAVDDRISEVKFEANKYFVHT